ncbi:unnamed protein product [Ectocarpus sp. 12 AP-2014]
MLLECCTPLPNKRCQNELEQRRRLNSKLLRPLVGFEDTHVASRRLGWYSRGPQGVSVSVAKKWLLYRGDDSIVPPQSDQYMMSCSPTCPMSWVRFYGTFA